MKYLLMMIALLIVMVSSAQKKSYTSEDKDLLKVNNQSIQFFNPSDGEIMRRVGGIFTNVPYVNSYFFEDFNKSYTLGDTIPASRIKIFGGEFRVDEDEYLFDCSKSSQTVRHDFVGSIEGFTYDLLSKKLTATKDQRITIHYTLFDENSDNAVSSVFKVNTTTIPFSGDSITDQISFDVSAGDTIVFQTTFTRTGSCSGANSEYTLHFFGYIDVTTDYIESIKVDSITAPVATVDTIRNKVFINDSVFTKKIVSNNIYNADTVFTSIVNVSKIVNVDSIESQVIETRSIVTQSIDTLFLPTVRVDTIYVKNDSTGMYEKQWSSNSYGLYTLKNIGIGTGSWSGFKLYVVSNNASNAAACIRNTKQVALWVQSEGGNAPALDVVSSGDNTGPYVIQVRNSNNSSDKGGISIDCGNNDKLAIQLGLNSVFGLKNNGQAYLDSIQLGEGARVGRLGTMAGLDFWTGTQAEWTANTPKTYNGVLVYPQATTTFWTIKD